MTRIVAFDVDGTLTAPRAPMNQKFASFFSAYVDERIVYLISGSDLPKIQEQVPAEILQKCAGVFACSGAELWIQDTLVYRKEHRFAEPLKDAAEHFVDTSPFAYRRGTHLEFRPGMLNVSVVGRQASNDDRRMYHSWDNQRKERLRFVERVNREFTDYEASAGGEISVDIVPKGWNKSVAKGELEQRHPGCSITFYGDRMDVHGNDRPLADALRADPVHHAVAVSDYRATWAILKMCRFDAAA